MERVSDHSVRIKVTNDCQWTCSFCHNEGTELPERQTKRVSVFLDQNVRRLPPVHDIEVNDATLEELAILISLGIKEVHLTGGEPTFHPQLPELITRLKDYGMEVKMTTNGQFTPETLKRIIDSGIDGITFSILSFDPKEFLSTQKIQSIKWAKRMIENGKRNILLAKDLGVDVKINLCITGPDDTRRIDTVREFAEEYGITLVLLPSIGERETTQDIVFQYAEDHARYLNTTENSNNSNGSRRYVTDNGTSLRAKYLRSYHPDIVCGGCEHNGKDSCVERFYGLRMEFRQGKPYMRLCVQQTNDQTVMPLTEFIKRDIISQLE